MRASTRYFDRFGPQWSAASVALGIRAFVRFAVSYSSAGVAGSLVSSQRLLPYAESRSLPRLTAVQNLERKQDLTSLTPKGGFVAAQPVEGIGRQVGQANKGAREVSA